MPANVASGYDVGKDNAVEFKRPAVHTVSDMNMIATAILIIAYGAANVARFPLFEGRIWLSIVSGRVGIRVFIALAAAAHI
jgi:hypothetical protein